jgi:hypothetical protein
MSAYKTALLIGLLFALPTLFGCPVRPITINPGFAFFEVLDADSSKDVIGPSQVQIEATVIEITPSIIPIDFFNSGSDPLTATVPLVGDPLLTSPLVDGDLGTTDTLLAILAPIELPYIDSEATVQAKFAQSRQVTIESVIVTYEGGMAPEPWDLALELEIPSQVLGFINIARTGRNTGILMGEIPIVGKLFFTRQSDETERTVEFEDILFIQATSWVTEPDEVNWPQVGRTNLVPGLRELPMIGNLFRREQVEARGERLLFFLAPVIIPVVD